MSGMHLAAVLIAAVGLFLMPSTSAHKLLITDDDGVNVVNMDDLSLDILDLPARSVVYAVDHHRATGDVYYSQVSNDVGVTRGIWRYDVSTGEAAVLLRAGVVSGIAVDWLHNNLYYVDTTDITLNVLSLDTGFTSVLFTGVDTDMPRAVRVDPRDDQRYVYWTDWGDDANIRRCGLDGNNCEILVDRDILWPNSISIEYTNGHLFWLEAHDPARVYRSNLDGSDKTMMLGISGNARGIDALSESTVYFTDKQEQTLTKLACHSTHCEIDDVYRGFLQPKDIQVYHHSRQPPGSDVCAGLHCPLCLPSAGPIQDYKYTCYNDQGTLSLRCSDHPDYCTNGGVCVEVFPRIRCRCVGPYVGPRCMQYTPPSGVSTTTTEPTVPSDVNPQPTSVSGSVIDHDACTSEGYTCMNGASCITHDDDAPYCDCLPGYQGTSCDIRDLSTYQKPWIQSVVPRYGPLDGGTRVTIRGPNLNVYGVATVYLGQDSNILCRDVFSNATILICVTESTDDLSVINVAQTLLIDWQFWSGLVVLDGMTFTYKPNPTVYSLTPMQTIVSGRTKITVSGIHLDSVEQPMARYQVVIPRKATEEQYLMTCEVSSDGSEMYCLTPKLEVAADVLIPSAQCREHSAHATSECSGDIEMWVGLYMDGVERYRDLRSALHQYSRLDPYLDPQIEKMSGPIVLKTWWPHSPKALTVKGMHLDYGALNAQYTVEIGSASCEDVEVKNEIIICHPPQEKPNVINGETRYYVNVTLGGWHQTVGHVTYETTILECTACTAALFVCLFVLLVIVAVVAVVVVCLRSKRRKDPAFVPPPPVCNPPHRTGIPISSQPPTRSCYLHSNSVHYNNATHHNRGYVTDEHSYTTGTPQQQNQTPAPADSDYTDLNL